MNDTVNGNENYLIKLDFIMIYNLLFLYFLN